MLHFPQKLSYLAKTEDRVIISVYVVLLFLIDHAPSPIV